MRRVNGYRPFIHQNRFNGGRGSQWKKQSPFQNWSSDLYTVFVENVSRIISKRTLWEGSNSYGKVMDVYISLFDKSGKPRLVTFAFVRFKLKSEFEKAILEGNNRLMNGRVIKAKAAKYKRFNNATSVMENNQGKKSVSSTPGLNRSHADGKVEASKSYKEALLGVNKLNDIQDKEGSASKEEAVCLDGVSMPIVGKRKEINYDLDIPHSDMVWLKCSAVGILKDSTNLLFIQEALRS
ncbi:hypothetical protein REPUB_Repub06bG0079100 [Reevesia pubescens]